MQILQLNVAKSGPRTKAIIDWCIHQQIDIILLQEIPHHIKKLNYDAPVRIVLPFEMSNGLPDTTKGRVYVATIVVNSSLVFSKTKKLDHNYYCEIVLKLKSSTISVANFL